MGQKKHIDAAIIGAGFGGLYMLKKLRDEHGLRARIFEKATDVGGTWYWNRYPGALSDTESYLYCYSWDKDLLQDWDFTTHYYRQPEILNYLRHVADRHNLISDIQFECEITSAHFDEEQHIWRISTNNGEEIEARYLITALGLLSATNFPNIKGRDRFEGELYHTGHLPSGVTFNRKSVGVIGTGSTGVQVITEIASKVGSLTVFQRSPQYSVPAQNGPVDKEYVDRIKRNYDAIWEQVRNSAVAFGFEESTVPAMSVSEDERRAVFQDAWDKGGGFRFMFGTFGDIATDERANLAAQDFIRAKIAGIVEDPETAHKLTPRDLYAKRPLCDSGYYQVFNMDNVELVDIRENPIEEIIPSGIRTSDGETHELDMLIFATGFDAVDGNYRRMDIRGRGAMPIKDHWKNGPTSFLGVTTAGYPNMFMILGPNGPFTNLPPSIEAQVEWISDLIGYANSKGARTVETTADSEGEWSSMCEELANMTLFPKAKSWIFGANIPGKAHAPYFYLGGLKEYRHKLAEVRESGYAGMRLT